MDDELKKLIKLIQNKEGGSIQEYRELLNKIAWHESAHTMDPNISQIGGGPGRGKYQFEEGKDRGAITAARRLQNFYDSENKNTPKWLRNVLKKDSLDVSTLSSAQQDMLLLGDFKMGTANLEDYFKGNIDLPTLWSKYHWSGPKSQKQDRLNAFKNSMETYNPREVVDISNNYYKNPVFNKSKLYTPSEYDVPTKQQSINNDQDLFSYLKLNKKNKNPTEPPIPQLPSRDKSLISFIRGLKNNKEVNKNYSDEEFNEINSGKTHEQNPLGGVIQGQNSTGRLNKVEEGETTVKLPDGKFVFSDRINTTKTNKSLNNKSPENIFELGGYLNKNNL